MRAQAGRAEASPESLLPSGQPSNPVGQGAGRHTQDSALAVTVSRAPICAGTGGARKPCDPLGLSAKPEPHASITPTVSPAPPPARVCPGPVQGRAWSLPGLLPFSVRVGYRAGTAPDPAPMPADLGSGAPSPDTPAARLPRRARGAAAHRAAPGGGGAGAARARALEPPRLRPGLPGQPQ